MLSDVIRKPYKRSSKSHSIMSTDFNKKGRRVAFMAQRDEPPYYSILGPRVVDFANAIESEIAAHNQDPKESNIAGAALGCFERFRGCMLYIWRMSQHEGSIIAKAPQNVGQMVGLSGAEILIDFESLLFHSRSSLDRIAFFAAKQIHNQDCDKYAKLTNVLSCFQKKDDRASRLIEIITHSNPLFEGVLFDISTVKKSLRSHVIHKSTASENARSLFTLHCIGPNKRIAFDSILDDYAIFKTCHNLGRGLPFVILNVLSLYLGMSQTLSLDTFELTWEPLMVDYRDYISECDDAKRFTLFNTDASGCSLFAVSLNPEIIKRAY